MTAIILIVCFALGLVLCLVTFVQTLYLETMRLRTRDLPSLQFFKSTVEDRIGFDTEEGTLSFSLLKHGTLLLLTIAVFFAYIHDGSATWLTCLEAAFTSWLLMMLVAYVVPQMLYRRSSGRLLLPMVPILRGFAYLVRPIVALLNFLHSLVELADEKTSDAEPPTSAENIDALISAGTEEGLIEEDDRKLIQNVVEFGDKVVREVMTSRPDIVAISADATLEELRHLVIHEQYSRIPVYEGSIDQVVGFVHVRDMFELGEEERKTLKIRELMRPIRFVPETKPVNDLMREMQQEGAHMVIVVDEYGNTAGLATMEDLVEVILGEIRDEHEPESEVLEESPGVYIVAGTFDLTRLENMLDFHPEEEIESTTVGGLVTEWLGRVPQAGEAVEKDGIRIEILASDELRVHQVRVRKVEVADLPRQGAAV
ncbi:MAG: domain containing protein [Bryobacterales bacterium]|nr:domain containing protein [Bryobacterales bacterium]